jgi:hypothetical protein
MSKLTDNSMDHLLHLPKQYLTPCQSQLLSKMRHILSQSQLNYNWRTKAATEDLHHTTTMCRSKGMITPSVVIPVWKQSYTLQKQKSGHHFIYLEDYVIQRQINKQSGFNAKQIEKDKYLESKTV